MERIGAQHEIDRAHVTTAADRSIYLRQLEQQARAGLVEVSIGFTCVADTLNAAAAEMMAAGRQVIDSILAWQQPQETARRQNEFPGSRPAWQRRK